MEIVIELENRNGRYLLVSAGYGRYKSSKPNAFFGDWISDEEEGTSEMACICDREGHLDWVPTSRVKVISINSRSMSELENDYKISQFPSRA